MRPYIQHIQKLQSPLFAHTTNNLIEHFVTPYTNFSTINHSQHVKAVILLLTTRGSRPLDQGARISVIFGRKMSSGRL